MTGMDLLVRPATAGDRADGLLYESARPYYDAFAGGEARARAMLAAVWAQPCHAASFEVCAVAEADGDVVGVMAGYPAADADLLSQRFLGLAVRRIPPWRWPGVARHLHAGARMSPHPPPDTYYVDALAVAEPWRRRGVARALLDEATARADAAELDGIALDTGLENAPARALYEREGFVERGVRSAPSAAAARAVGGPGFVAYYRPRTAVSDSATRAT
jgi:ribosomal protein S18 acetylase RimI-like enzyme